MVKSLAILSHKGGVGKTSLAVNLAVHLATEGKNICLIDSDFHGPSILTFFTPKPEIHWINSFLTGDSSLEECLQDLSNDLALSGKLLVAFADPTPESIQHVIRLDQNTSMKMLHYLMKMKSMLREEPYSIDYLILDCSPGTGFSTINVMVITEIILFMVKVTNADIIGTSHMIEGLHKQLKSRTKIIANQIPSDFLNDQTRKEHFQKLIENLLKKDLGDKTVDFMGWIPNDLDLYKTEFETAIKTLEGNPTRRMIHTLDKPNHIISKIIKELANNLFGDNN